MADFSVADVKKLRERTGAGLMDAKKALTEAGGDIAPRASPPPRRSRAAPRLKVSSALPFRAPAAWPLK